VTLVRVGRSYENAVPIHQHSDDDRQQEVAAGLDAAVRKTRSHSLSMVLARICM
jgi:hypothetical protein